MVDIRLRRSNSFVSWSSAVSSSSRLICGAPTRSKRQSDNGHAQN